MIMIAYNHRGLSEDGEPSPSGTIGAALYDAFSRGEVRLLSADPEANSVVEENMLPTQLSALSPLSNIAIRVIGVLPQAAVSRRARLFIRG
jgi:hypothetical protein